MDAPDFAVDQDHQPCNQGFIDSCACRGVAQAGACLVEVLVVPRGEKSGGGVDLLVGKKLRGSPRGVVPGGKGQVGVGDGLRGGRTQRVGELLVVAGEGFRCGCVEVDATGDPTLAEDGE
jgi:hypothetical protein